MGTSNQTEACSVHAVEMDVVGAAGAAGAAAPVCADSVPQGFLAGAGEVRVQLAVPRGPGAPCACCALLAPGADAAPAKVHATLSADGGALAFWSAGAGGWELRASVPRARLGCECDAVLDALRELEHAARGVLYSARLLAAPGAPAGAGTGAALAAAAAAGACSTPGRAEPGEPCRHVVVFTVHFAHSLFGSRALARDAEAGRCLRRVLGRFSGEAAAHSRGAAESREVEAMRRAAQCLGLAPPANAMHAFLDMPLSPSEASGLRGKFRLEQVLQSIVQPSSSAPPCGTAADVGARDPHAEPSAENPAAGPRGSGEGNACWAPAPRIKTEDRSDPKGKRAMSPDCQPSTSRRGLSVLSLPADALVQMLELLEPRQLDAISLACKSMHAAARICVPGLRLQLYKHQRRAMEIMMAREKSPCTVWNPAVTRFTCTTGATEYFVAHRGGGIELTWGNGIARETQDTRGGLLCDEPGMGKTITVLALILKTRRRLASPFSGQIHDEQSGPAWTGEASGKRRATVEDAGAHELVELPRSLVGKRFRFFLAAPDGGTPAHSFTWQPPTPIVSAVTGAAVSPMGSPSARVSSAKSSVGMSTERRTSGRVGSLVTPLLRRSRAWLQSAVYASSATLIVAPATLVDHWKFQITAHTREGVLRVLAVTNSSEIQPAAQMAEYDVVLTTFDVLSKQWAVGSPTPGSDRWYKLHGTIGQGSQSWRFSPGEYKGVAAATQRREGFLSSPAAAESSEFQRVRWVRVVLDEGHVMGASSETNRALMLASITAGAKWICTGTPAPSTPAAELQHMYGLISALGIQPYEQTEAWRSLIHAPFEMHDLSAWMRLHALLSRIMIRSVKADMERLGEIPTCTVITTELELSLDEKRAYNGLMTIIKRNLVLSECGGSRVDSLLHQKNRKYALEAINNARKACCITGQFDLQIVRAHLDECIRDMRRGHSLHEAGCQCNGTYFDVPTLKQMSVLTRTGDCNLLQDQSRVVLETRVRAVEQAFAGLGGSQGTLAVVSSHDRHIRCDACERLSVFPFITPCGHMICMDCVDKDAQQVPQYYCSPIALVSKSAPV